MEIKMEKSISKEGFWDKFKPEKSGKKIFEDKKAQVKEKELELKKKIERDDKLAKEFKEGIADRAEPIQRKIDAIDKVLADDTITADRAMELRQEKYQLCDELYNLYSDADSRSVQYYDVNYKSEVFESAGQLVRAQQDIDGGLRIEATPVKEEDLEKSEEIVQEKEVEQEKISLLQARAEVLEKEIDKIVLELEKNAEITMERAMELMARLAKLMAEALKIYASMVNQSGQQYH